MIRVSVSSNLKIIVLIKQRFVSAYLKLFNDQSILKRTVSISRVLSVSQGHSRFNSSMNDTLIATLHKAN